MKRIFLLQILLTALLITAAQADPEEIKVEELFDRPLTSTNIAKGVVFIPFLNTSEWANLVLGPEGYTIDPSKVDTGTVVSFDKSTMSFQWTLKGETTVRASQFQEESGAGITVAGRWTCNNPPCYLLEARPPAPLAKEPPHPPSITQSPLGTIAIGDLFERPLTSTNISKGVVFVPFLNALEYADLLLGSDDVRLHPSTLKTGTVVSFDKKTMTFWWMLKGEDAVRSSQFHEESGEGRSVAGRWTSIDPPCFILYPPRAASPKEPTAQEPKPPASTPVAKATVKPKAKSPAVSPKKVIKTTYDAWDLGPNGRYPDGTTPKPVAPKPNRPVGYDDWGIPPQGRQQEWKRYHDWLHGRK